MITTADERLLRRAIGIAARAVAQGDAPYGSLLAGPDGTVLAEAHNTVRRDDDITAHPELKLARWAARELDPATAARTTLYTSCQPCGMCAGAIVRSGLGRVVHALSTEQLIALDPASGAWPAVRQDGPALLDEARVPVEAYGTSPRPARKPPGHGSAGAAQ
ncbi:nucleoside deaminase [Streptomyces sp. NPDC056387]|uniref:nucleoside deaminase n=1 Tax=Streptomyces sp. NPDC056387 TaxID=3345803 RepID=UPI0035E16C80